METSIFTYLFSEQFSLPLTTWTDCLFSPRGIFSAGGWVGWCGPMSDWCRRHPPQSKGKHVQSWWRHCRQTGLKMANVSSSFVHWAPTAVAALGGVWSHSDDDPMLPEKRWRQSYWARHHASSAGHMFTVRSCAGRRPCPLMKHTRRACLPQSASSPALQGGPKK